MFKAMTAFRPGRRHFLTSLLVMALAAMMAFSAPSAFAKSKSKKERLKEEKKLIMKLMDLHQREITFATWVGKQTTHTELNAFCQTFILHEQAEMTTLTTWLKSWHKTTYVPKRRSIEEDVMEDFEELDEDDGDEAAFEFAFDLVALEKFKSYDKRESQLMKEVRKKAVHEELKQFMTETRMFNAEEEAMLRAWIIQLEDLRSDLIGDDDDDDDDEDDD